MVAKFAITELTSMISFMTNDTNKQKFHNVLQVLNTKKILDDQGEQTISTIIQSQLEKCFVLNAHLFEILMNTCQEAIPDFVLNIDLCMMSLIGFLSQRSLPVVLVHGFDHAKTLRNLFSSSKDSIGVTQSIYSSESDICEIYNRKMDNTITTLLKYDFASLVNVYYSIYKLFTDRYFYEDTQLFNEKQVYSMFDFELYTLDMNRINRFKKRGIDICKDEELFVSIFRNLNISRYRKSVPDMYIADACGLSQNELLDFNARIIWITICPQYPPSCVLEALYMCHKTGNISNDSCILNEVKRIYAERISTEYSIMMQRTRRFYKFKTVDDCDPKEMKAEDVSMCCICFKDEFTEDDSLVLLQDCEHVFCCECITPWLQSKSNCPMCRKTQTKRSRSIKFLPNTESIEL